MQPWYQARFCLCYVYACSHDAKHVFVCAMYMHAVMMPNMPTNRIDRQTINTCNVDQG